MQVTMANTTPQVRSPHRGRQVCRIKGGLGRRVSRWIALAVLLTTFLTCRLNAQTPPEEDVTPVPLLTGSTGFITTFNGGQPDYHPIITPLLLVPIGKRWVFETRATFETDLAKVPGRSGYHGGPVQKEVEYAQLDFIANQYVTVTVGRFLTPFGICLLYTSPSPRD